MTSKSKDSVAGQAGRAAAKALLAVGALALSAALLSGCGQKGPLTLPSSPAPASAPASAPATR